MEYDPKADLHSYLQTARDTVLWKLDGLSEYDVRRPLTPTGTNLLGLVKHLATVELGYFGDTFGRPLAKPFRGLRRTPSQMPTCGQPPMNPAKALSGCTAVCGPTRMRRSPACRSMPSARYRGGPRIARR